MDTVKFFLGRGANIDVRDKGGKAPLDLAIQENYVNIIEILKQAQLSRELFTAVQGGDFNKVQDLVKQGASLKTKDKYSNTLLHCASWSGQLSIVKYLTEEGASLEAKNHHGKTPLHEASWDNCLSIVKYFVENGANFEAKDKEGSTPLHYASRRGQLNIVRYLVENKANFNTKDHSEGTPLHNASRNGYLKVVEYLVENGADFEAKDYNSRTPVHDASLNGNLDIVKYFAKEWANLEAKDKNGKTPLDLADQKGYTNIVKILKQALLDRELLNAARNSNLDKVKDLIKDGASLEAKDWHGSTPLHHASLNGNLDMVEYLIRQNVTLDVQNLYGSTPVHDASWSGHLKVVEYLIENKADFEVEDKYGQTPLHHASRNGHLKVVECLIEKGASLVTDKYGKTPLDLASQKDYTNIVEFLKQVQLDRELFTAIQDGNHDKVKDLIKNGASLESKNKDGKTPTDLATQKGDIDIVKILKQAKLDRELFTAVQDSNHDKVKDLIKNGASLQAKNKDNKTPLDLAIQNGSRNVVKILKQAQSDRNLLTAVRSGNLDKVEDLVINQHANVNANIGMYNYTPLHHAADTNMLDIAKFLVGAGANLGAKDDYGKTPLDIARDRGNSDIIKYLKEKLNQERERPVQRRRRHHHGDHDRRHGHLSRKPLAIDSSNQPEIAASSGTRPSSWINDLFGWVKSSISGLLDSKSSTTTKIPISQIDAPMDVNGTIMLLDVLVRKVTGQKYISTVDQPISSLEAQGYALNITKGFEKVVEQAGLKSGVSMHRLNIDFVEIQKEVTGKIMSGNFDEISGILKSYIKKACTGGEAGKLSPKKFDKFMVQFNSRLNVVLNQPIQQMLHNRDGRLEVDGTKKQQMSLELQSYLSNASIQSHSKVSTCLSEIGVTKLGGNLNR